MKHATDSIENASVELGGKLPPNFQVGASEKGRIYTLKGNATVHKHTYTHGSDLDTQITLSKGVSLCYMSSKTLNPGDTYRIYATNSNNLSVFYVYDSATGRIEKRDNPDRKPAATGDGQVSRKGGSRSSYGPVTCTLENCYLHARKVLPPMMVEVPSGYRWHAAGAVAVIRRAVGDVCPD